jgi:hypothetical protein
MRFWDYVQLEIIKTGLTGLTLVLGWFVGQRIIAYWDIRKKRQEFDIATAAQFQKLYGEFKEVSRLWRIFTYSGERKLALPDTMPVELLRRATAAEGGIEAIIVKLATERVLEQEDIQTLGLFRQAYQKLREAIRNGEALEWTYGTPEYFLYNHLASKIACIIAPSKTERRPALAEAPSILQKITEIRSEHWKQELNRLRSFKR